MLNKQKHSTFGEIPQPIFRQMLNPRDLRKYK